jgi:hypothetical protein
MQGWGPNSRKAVVFSCAGLLACGADDAAPQPQYEEAGPMPIKAQCPADLAKFAIGEAGLSVTDSEGRFSVRIDDASAAPPEKNFNDWTIAVLDADGKGMSEARINWACAWMAVHGHGSNPQSIEALGEGRFVLKRQNLSMVGPWAVFLWIDPSGAGAQYMPQRGTSIANGYECKPSNGTKPAADVEFDFCVPEDRGGS